VQRKENIEEGNGVQVKILHSGSTVQRTMTIKRTETARRKETVHRTRTVPQDGDCSLCTEDADATKERYCSLCRAQRLKNIYTVLVQNSERE
jgi:hypothetical protein